MSIGAEYLRVIHHRFRDMKSTAEKAMAQLTKEEYHWHPNDDSNSIAVIVKHMSGNMVSRWTGFLTTDGEKVDRKRDDEFIDDLDSVQEIMEVWERGWHTFLVTLNDLTEKDLLKTVTIRGEAHSVIQAIERQMYHYANHVGQIIYIAKLLKSDQWQSLTIPRKRNPNTDQNH